MHLKKAIDEATWTAIHNDQFRETQENVNEHCTSAHNIVPTYFKGKLFAVLLLIQNCCDLSFRLQI